MFTDLIPVLVCEWCAAQQGDVDHAVIHCDTLPIAQVMLKRGEDGEAIPTCGDHARMLAPATTTTLADIESGVGPSWWQADGDAPVWVRPLGLPTDLDSVTVGGGDWNGLWGFPS